MSKADLYIIAAGKGSRMGGPIPKALVPITDVPNATTILQQASGKFRKVFLVVNKDVGDQWAEWRSNLEETFPDLSENLCIVPIQSGLGDGHAVMEGLRMSNPFEPVDDIVVCWGDAFFTHSETFDEILGPDISMAAGFVPVKLEENPYVSIQWDNGDRVKGALFSKFGETVERGSHDQSIFRFHRPTLQIALENLHCAFFRNGAYMAPKGELSLLFVFHYLYNRGEMFMHCFETDYPTMSFNTPEEVAEIQKEIDRKWKEKS